jgi:hypothetical protein
MKNSRKFISCLALFFLACIICAPAFAQTKQDVVASMKNRYAALTEAKNKGLVGEAWTGLAGLVKQDAPADIKQLVEAENNDRRQLFKIIAEETATSIQEVARQNRIRMYRLAKDLHFIQNSERSWVRKKDLKN